MKKAHLLLLLWAALPLAAQQTSSIDCTTILPDTTLPSTTQPTPLIGGELTALPEISSVDGVLSGMLYTVSEQVRMPAGKLGSAVGNKDNPLFCYPQWVRAYRKEKPTSWNPPSSDIHDPKPGPILRAKVGDVVNLSFFNTIDAGKFPNSDRGCDETNVYPENGKPVGDPKRIDTGDEYPDCFSQSVFTNVHYHGTHTSPNTTADNVFITVRPSPRATKTGDPCFGVPNTPCVTEKTVKNAFDSFFADCNAQLKTATGPDMWPREWSDLDKNHNDLQQLLMELVKIYGREGWYEDNEALIRRGYWPQYFVGAYPYCFKLPNKSATAATTVSAAVQSPHTHGAGSAEVSEAAAPGRPLVMGQAPGTHWYHAHKHGSTTINVMNGMTGAFIIEGDYDQKLKDFYKSNFSEKVLVIQQLGSVPPLVTGGAGGDVNFFVNGKLRPVLKMAGNSVQMWRIANTAGRAGAYFVAPAANTLQWRQLAVDGVQLTPKNYLTRPSEFLLASGNRIDLLVKAPAFNKASGGNNKYNVIVYNVVAPNGRPPINPKATPLTLFTVEVTNDGIDMKLIPEGELAPQPKFLGDITDEEITGTKILTFSTNKPKGRTADWHMIDGQRFNGELGAVVELNRAEEWKIVNETYGPLIAHPFHIHINPFQLTEIFEPNAYFVPAPCPGTVSVTKDSQAVVGDSTTFTVSFRVGDIISINGAQGGEIAAITSEKQMSLKAAATATITGAQYQAVIPRYTIDAAPRTGQCRLDPIKPKTWVPCAQAGVEPDKERVWWDVFPIPTGKTFTSGTTTVNIPGYFKMRSRFVDYPGYFVLHCHILAHEDRGMMTVVEVTPLQTPYSHH